MTCSVPQGSWIGPLVWNVMYDDFLRLELPDGTNIIGFADDALVVCGAEDVRILELRINESLRWSGKQASSTWGCSWIQRRLLSAQRGAALRIVSAYRALLTGAVFVLVSVPPIDLLAKEGQETFQLQKELACITDLQEIARAKKANRKDGRHRLVERWQMRWHCEQTGRWTYRLFPELATWLNRKQGEVGFYLAQALSGHGCLNAYLQRFKKRDQKTRRRVSTAIPLRTMRRTQSSSALNGV